MQIKSYFSSNFLELILEWILKYIYILENSDIILGFYKLGIDKLIIPFYEKIKTYFVVENN